MPACTSSTAGSFNAEDLVLARFHLAHHARRPPPSSTSMPITSQAWGRPSRAATSDAVTPQPRSSDCEPVRTRSKGSRADRRGERARGRHRVAGDERGVMQVGCSVGAQGERFAQRLAHPLGAEAEHHDLAAGLLLDLERRLERALVALVDDEREVLLLDPRTLLVEAQAGLGVGHLLDADRDLHGFVRRAAREAGAYHLDRPVLVPARPSCYLLRRNDECRYTYLSSACSRRHQAPRISVVWELFLDAGPVDKFVLALLVFFSLVSWGIILSKGFQFRRADQQTRRFLEIFRTSKRFSEVNTAAANHSASPLVGTLPVRLRRDRRSGEGGAGRGQTIRRATASGRWPPSSARCAGRVGVELHVLTRSTQFLATTAAAAPFIGLFGTVWGILQAFNDIGITGSTSITAVAPGIAGALINTAAGLVAAIPALVAYNTFSTRVRRMREEMEDFVLEFMNLTERNFT